MHTAAAYDLYDDDLISALAGWGPFGGGPVEDVLTSFVDLGVGPAAAEYQPDYSSSSTPASPRWANQTRLNERAAAAAEDLVSDLVSSVPWSARGAVQTEQEPVVWGDGAHATHTRAPVYHSLYKTELCRSFEETGTCRYGAKCQFAHGQGELRAVLRHPRYKTELCRTFTSSGSCPYGTRCRFIHYRGAAAAATAPAPGGAKMTVTVPRFPGSNPPSPKSPSSKPSRNADNGATPPASPRSSFGTSVTDSPSPRSQSSLDGGSRSMGSAEPPSPTDSVKSHHRLPIFATLVPEEVGPAEERSAAPRAPDHVAARHAGAAASSTLPAPKQAHPKTSAVGSPCRKGGNGRAAQRHHQAGQHGATSRVGYQSSSSKQAAQ